VIPRFDDPKRYREVFDSLAKKWFARGRLDRLEVSGTNLAELRGHTRPLAKLLAKTVAADGYRFSPSVPVEALIEGKRRVLYQQNLLDRVVLTVVAKYLVVLSEPLLLPVLHSYRSGYSSWKAIGALIAYLHEHRSRLPLRERGLFVLRRDVRKYGERIDTGPGSPLWTMIGRAVRSDPDVNRRELGERLIAAAVRQPVVGPDGSVAPLGRGVPTGSPIQPPCANLYLSSVDERCASVEEGFYARFGDDILFCHPDPSVARQVSQDIDAQLESLGLESKLEKRLDLDFNGAGRKRFAGAGFRPCHRLTYLGAAIDFNGNLGLKPEKARIFERALRARLGHVAEALRDDDREARIQGLCEATRTALQPTDPLAVGAAQFLRYLGNDRAQLRDLDYRVALTVAELVAGCRGPRAFRAVSYRELRRKGLPSLVKSRERSRPSNNGAT
jgi:hypothetical protein